MGWDGLGWGGGDSSPMAAGRAAILQHIGGDDLLKLALAHALHRPQMHLLLTRSLAPHTLS